MAIERSGPVVVGVDESAAGLAAVDLAAEEAMARVTPLLVLHAYEGLDGERLAGRRRLVEIAAARARAQHPGLSVATNLVRGDPVAVLVGQSRRASLLVVGHAPGRTAGRSAAVTVATAADVPVMIHRPRDGRPGTPGPVLVGVEGLAGADRLLAFGFAEAALRGADLLALHVWSEPADLCPFGTGPDAHRGAAGRAEAQRLLDDALSVWADKYPEVAAYRAVRDCLDAGIALTAASRSAQLVVVGASQPPPGPVLPVLLHRAGCPVVSLPDR